VDKCQIYGQELDGNVVCSPDALPETSLMTLCVLAFDLIAPLPVAARDVHEVGVSRQHVAMAAMS
jgi:hypothetical protein